MLIRSPLQMNFMIISLIYLIMALISWVILVDRRGLSVHRWCAGSVLFGVGLFFMGMRGLVPDWASFTLAQALLFFGSALHAQALQLERGRAWRTSWLAALGLGYLAIFSALHFKVGSESLRAGFASLVQAILIAAVAWSAWRLAQEQQCRSAQAIALVSLVMVSHLVVRISTFNTSMTNVQLWNQTPMVFLVTFIVGLMVAIISHVGYIGITLERLYHQEVTARACAEEESARADRMAHQAEEASRTKSDFLAGMSHEIRTPMSGMIGMIGLLLKGPLDAKHLRYAQLARTCGEQLLTIINDILDFSKIEAGKLELEEVDFSLGVVLEDLRLLLSVRAEEKSLVLFLGPLPGTPDLLRGDPIRLKQVLLNLIGNALKFTAKGAVLVQVETLAMTAEEVRLRFRVIDTGMGIPAGKLETIFQKFTQADSSTTRNYGGTGLGLPICRQLAALMGGEIGVSSVEDWGSEFWFTAQLRLAARETLEPIGGASGLAPVHVRPELETLRILLADDSEENQLLAVTLRKGWGVTVEVVGDGLQALEALRKIRYDLVLMDIRMALLDGFEATAQLRKAESGVLDPLVPVVAMTASALPGDCQRCQDAGMNDHLSKPIEPEAILATLRRHCGRSPDRTGSGRQQPAPSRPPLDPPEWSNGVRGPSGP